MIGSIQKSIELRGHFGSIRSHSCSVSRFLSAKFIFKSLKEKESRKEEEKHSPFFERERERERERGEREEIFSLHVNEKNKQVYFE